MRAIICSIVLLIFVNCPAQDLLTLREVFDYNIGDVFQYVDEAYPQYNKETIKILSKSYSTNEDTVMYLASSQLYYIVPEIDSLFSEFDTLQLIYTNLDSSIFEYKPEYKYDSLIKDGGNLDYYDTIIEYNTDLCNEFVNGYRFLDFEFYREYLFGKGIGIVEEMIPMSDSPGECNKCRELVYFRKSDKSCGDYDITNLGNTHLSDCNVNFYPNPAKNYIVINIIDQNIDDFILNILDFSGRILISKRITKDYKIDVSDLPKGSYILSVNMKNKNESHILYIQ